MTNAWPPRRWAAKIYAYELYLRQEQKFVEWLDQTNEDLKRHLQTRGL